MKDQNYSSINIHEEDCIDLYFECISRCHIINDQKKFIIRCAEIHLKGGNQNE